MIVGIHDSDKTKFPNLALMKISAWHKARGDDVQWFMPVERYDRVYSSKVFTFTPENPYLPADTIKGGTGYGIYENLPDCMDAMFPDYSIYPDCHYAIGFLTRGCIRHCSWCVVPKKEGSIRPYSTWQQVKRPDSRDLVLMDNNILASEFGIAQLVSMIGQDVRIDCNQGLDARLVTPEIADILSRLKWIRFIRTACDTDSEMDAVEKMTRMLNLGGVLPYRIFVYVLVRDIESAERRVQFLRNLGVDIFAQPYRDLENNILPTQEQRDFARWVNVKSVFKAVPSFRQYVPIRNQRKPSHVGKVSGEA